MLAGNLEWWNIVPHESLCSLDSEVDDEACVGLVDSDGIEDFLDKSEWLEELRELNNIQEASFKTKDPNNSDEVLFSNSNSNQQKCTSMSCQYEKCACNLSFHYVALMKNMRKHPRQLPLYQGMRVIKHMRRVSVADQLVAIPITFIKRKCMRIECGADKVFVCHLPNSFEKD